MSLSLLRLSGEPIWEEFKATSESLPGGTMVERKGRMTDRERMEALLRREKPDRVPVYPWALGFAMVYSHNAVAEFYNKPDVSLAAQRKVCKDLGWVSLPHIGYGGFGSWEFGGEIEWPRGQFSQAPMVSLENVKAMNKAVKDYGYY